MAPLMLRSGSFTRKIFLQNVMRVKWMARQCSSDVRLRLSVGTIGHVDHGKTSLTAAITKVLSEQGGAKYMKYNDIDRAPEEKARGITINACHVGYSTAKRDYAHTDCPGHIDYIKNMIVGTSQMDGAVLVVAATDGLMPQTREHVMLAMQIGVKNIIVYINKVDIVEDDIIELVELEISELLEEVGYNMENIPFVTGSALCALNSTRPEIGRDSIVKLLDCLDAFPAPDRLMSGPFVMPIESAVTLPGRGTIVIGTILEGSLTKSQNAVIQGFGKTFNAAVTSVGMFDKTVQKAAAGDNVGLLVKGVRKEAIQRGMYISDPDSGVTEHNAFRAQLYVRRKSEGGRSQPLRTKYIQTLFIDTWNISSCIFLPDDVAFVMPGDTIVTDVLLRNPMVVRKGQKFIIRDGPLTSISGVILELLPDSDQVIPGFNWDWRKNIKPVTEAKAKALANKSNVKKKVKK